MRSLLLALLCFLPSAARADEPAARVVSAESLTISETRGVPGRAARAGDNVRDGAFLLLARGGAAEIRVGENRVRLGPAQTLLRLRAGRLANIQITLYEGITRHEIAPIPENASYQVVTAAASSGVRGTVFTVAAAADGSGYVDVESGTVENYSKIGEDPVAIGAGEAVEKTPGGDLASVEPKPAGVIEAWSSSKEEAFDLDPAPAAEGAAVEAEAASAEGRAALAASAGVMLRLGRMIAARRLNAENVDEAIEILHEALGIWRTRLEAEARLDAARYLAARAREKRPDLSTEGIDAPAAAFESENAAKAQEVERLSEGLEKLAGMIRIARAARFFPLGGFRLPF